MIPFLLAACATGIRALDPSAGGVLEPGEGLLILHVDTEVPIAEIDVNGGTIASGLPTGHHVWLVRAAAGSYRFTALRGPSSAGPETSNRLPADDEFRFQVEPGCVNYGAALVVRSSPRGLEIRGRNHVAMALRRLRDPDAELVANHPLRYGGLSEDGFLDYYSRERDAVRQGER